MEPETMLSELYSAGTALQNHTDSIKASQVYCAKSEIYIRWIRNNRELATEFLNNFCEYRDRVFRQSCEILDIAVKFENPELAQAAMNQIKEIRKLYPEVYTAYYNRMFGRKM